MTQTAELGALTGRRIPSEVWPLRWNQIDSDEYVVRLGGRAYEELRGAARLSAREEGPSDLQLGVPRSVARSITGNKTRRRRR